MKIIQKSTRGEVGERGGMSKFPTSGKTFPSLSREKSVKILKNLITDSKNALIFSLFTHNTTKIT